MDVYFEEQNLHSIEPSSEFYIAIYGSIAQSESENISHNVAWGKAQSAKEGNVFIAYNSFLGYRKGADGKPEIDPEQAQTVRLIYNEFLAGKSLQQIANNLTEAGVPKQYGSPAWCNPSYPMRNTREMHFSEKHTSKIVSAKRSSSIPENVHDTM